MQFYTCDPSWPICLYDFTYRNLNPTFNTLKIEQPLTFLLRESYFSVDKLSKRAPPSRNPDPAKVISVPSADLVI